MGMYDADKYFKMGRILELPQQDLTLEFWEGKGGIHVRLSKGSTTVTGFLPKEIWEEMGGLSYTLHPQKIEEVDKVQKAMDQVKKAEGGP